MLLLNCIIVLFNGESKNVEKGGGGRQFITRVVLLSFIANAHSGLLNGKRRFKKTSEPIGGAPPPPLNPPLALLLVIHISIFLFAL